MRLLFNLTLMFGSMRIRFISEVTYTETQNCLGGALFLMKLRIFYLRCVPERMMVRWMCGVSLKDRKCSMDLCSLLGIQCVADVVRHGRLRWFGHILSVRVRMIGYRLAEILRWRGEMCGQGQEDMRRVYER